MPCSSRTSVRVLARHLHGAIVLRDVPATTLDVIYSDGGIVSGADVARLLEDRLGALLRVRFRASGARHAERRAVGRAR